MGKNNPIFLDIGNGIHCAVYADNWALGTAFVRFQEHYESPHFRGKIFSRAEFRTWYRKSTGRKEYTYPDDWGGFNVPDTVFQPFLAGKFDPLISAEKRLLDGVRDIPPPFYLIGVYATCPGLLCALRHETAHALWYLQPEYRKVALQVVEALPGHVRNDMAEALLASSGYNEAMIADEVQAYFLDSHQSGPDMKVLARLQRELRNAFDRFAPDLSLLCLMSDKEIRQTNHPSGTTAFHLCRGGVQGDAGQHGGLRC